jgi:protein TonB
MLQDTPEQHLEHLAPLSAEPASFENETDVQRKRMLMALGILLVALIAVIAKDWDFWFPPDSGTQEAAIRSPKKHAVPIASVAPAAPLHEHKQVKAALAPAPKAPLSATTERATLPPLEVEVVAGNRHVGVPAKSTAIHVDVDTGASSPAAGSSTASSSRVSSPAPVASVPVVNAGGRTQLSPQASQSVTVSVPPNYPLLAREMKVQGAVSLRALISREGNIQELQILSGPGILAAAAREAVKQWHFKPYLQDGQAVETQARITVNFTISTN